MDGGVCATNPPVLSWVHLGKGMELELIGKWWEFMGMYVFHGFQCMVELVMVEKDGGGGEHRFREGDG